MDEATIEVYLRIRHPNLDPGEITEALGQQPEHCWAAGDVRPAGAEADAATRYAESYWFGLVRVPAEFENLPNLEGMLMLAAGWLKSRKHLWKRISEEGGRAELLVTLQTEGTTNIDLTSETMSMLNGIGLSSSIGPQSQFAAA